MKAPKARTISAWGNAPGKRANPKAIRAEGPLHNLNLPGCGTVFTRIDSVLLVAWTHCRAISSTSYMRVEFGGTSGGSPASP